MRRAALLLSTALLLAAPAAAAEYSITPTERTEMKAVFGRVEARDTVQARARIGGTIVSLQVEEGTAIKNGDLIAMVVDDKLALQLDAVDARLKALEAELQNAVTELERAKKLLQSGTVAKSRVDALQTQVDVLTNQVTATQADRAVLVQQGSEGQVIAPGSGRVLTVPVTRGSVVMPGETIARIAGGGYFLRLSLPERHAANLHEGDTVMVGARGIGSADPGTDAGREGLMVKVYPEIEGGRVLADVEVDGLGDYFVGERTLVWIPVARREVIGVPPEAVSTRSGIDYVTLATAGGEMDVPVITGETFETAQGPRVEVLSGLQAGDKVVTP